MGHLVLFVGFKEQEAINVLLLTRAGTVVQISDVKRLTSLQKRPTDETTHEFVQLSPGPWQT